MDFESVRKFVEKNEDFVGVPGKSMVDSMPRGFIEPIVMQGLTIDRVEIGRVVCSFTVPERLVEEIEIESRALQIGKAFAAVSVEFRSKNTGKVIAQGRHTKYLAVPSKM